jgi:hypothetical protein
MHGVGTPLVRTGRLQGLHCGMAWMVGRRLDWHGTRDSSGPADTNCAVTSRRMCSPYTYSAPNSEQEQEILKKPYRLPPRHYPYAPFTWCDPDNPANRQILPKPESIGGPKICLGSNPRIPHAALRPTTSRGERQLRPVRRRRRRTKRHNSTSSGNTVWKPPGERHDA